jgi:hypothetical protein
MKARIHGNKSLSVSELTGRTGWPRQSMRGHSPNPLWTYFLCCSWWEVLQNRKLQENMVTWAVLLCWSWHWYVIYHQLHSTQVTLQYVNNESCTVKSHHWYTLRSRDITYSSGNSRSSRTVQNHQWRTQHGVISISISFSKRKQCPSEEITSQGNDVVAIELFSSAPFIPVTVIHQSDLL